MKIPLKLSPSPLSEAVVEVRIDPTLPPDAIFGVVYNEIKEDYTRITKLPILQLPDEVRSKDPNLMFKPYYTLTKEQFIFMLGPRVIALATKDYPGWDIFFKEIISLFRTINDLRISRGNYRIGMRYINSFPGNIFEHSNLSINLDKKDQSNQPIYFRTDIKDNDFTSTLTVTNKAEFSDQSEVSEGSVIDIDTYILSPDLSGDAEQKFKDMLNEEHSICKKLFFGLLKEEFLSTYSPIY